MSRRGSGFEVVAQVGQVPPLKEVQGLDLRPRCVRISPQGGLGSGL